MTKTEFKSYIATANFTTMFREELLWNKDNSKQNIVIDDEPFAITGIAEKCGLKILALNANTIPTADVRKKIDTQVRKLFFHYILIMHNADRQVWLVPTKKNDKRELVTVEFASNQDVEFLYQKITQLTYSLTDEETLTIVDVSKKVNDVFTVNSEKITTEFYKQFSLQHKAFKAFIEGIDQEINLDWYASLMLNRLMFCYFIQKKRFLDNNLNYLRDKLNLFKNSTKVKSAIPPPSGELEGAFYSFYRSFLLTLFHEGLGAPNNIKHKALIGKIPYLNGGLFDTHELETTYGSKINISDKAFEKIFDFFDQYEWHLDTRITATGKDINPDVIGYIFEKYINDRAQMGAYYTKEDITEYISKNCILPFLFDETNRLLKTETIDIASLIQPTNENFIYDAVKKGTQIELPKNIEKGIKKVADRTEWNKPAPAEYALPTEIWREVIDRRSRYNDVLHKIQKGEVNTINDFITYNLNITGFTYHFLETTTNPQHIQYFYKALNKVTIIDPTCGSGAFLFAAMNILEPLYEVCINRMEEFVEKCNDENNYKHLSPTIQKSYQSIKSKESWFRQQLAQVKSPQHPNLAYFIYKTIILRNLYGVDIMKEATEIAKLRLFLKLVATVDANFSKPNYGLEPLPDIDFNIRAGNTLVGFATEKELDKALTYTLDGVAVKPTIKENMEIVAMAYQRFKDIQLNQDNHTNQKNHSADSFKKAKEELNIRLKELNHQLNQLLHKQATAYKYNDWLASHQPFHWFAEFYEIINDNGGFDVVIGNPPYVVYTASNFEYKLKDYDTLSCSNLYAYCCERSFKIMNKYARFGMIIPNSSISADKLEPLQKVFIKNKSSWISNYSWRPAKLFEGANMLVAIVLSTINSKNNVHTTIYNKWYNDFRDSLFENIAYTKATEIIRSGTIPKIPNVILFSIIQKLKLKSANFTILNYFSKQPTTHKFYYFRAVLYWVKILENEPTFREDGIQTTTGEMKTVFVQNEDLKYILISLLSSSLYFMNYVTWSSCQVINSRDFELPFCLENLSDSLKKELVNFGKKIQKDYQLNSEINVRNYSAKNRTFTMEKQYFYIKHSKPIIDEIDKVLAQHYGFTDEELDFIINYDIKYRMGKELDSEE